jgi:hypothetical protein
MRCPRPRPVTISCRRAMTTSKPSGGVAAGIGIAAGIGAVGGGAGEQLHDRPVRPMVAPVTGVSNQTATPASFALFNSSGSAPPRLRGFRRARGFGVRAAVQVTAGQSKI